jgi:hypothetical protein
VYNPFMEPTVITSVVALLVLVVIVMLWRVVWDGWSLRARSPMGD